MNKILVPKDSAYERRKTELESTNLLYLNGFNVQRIVYELIKNYMMDNTPEECGIRLEQKYDPDPTKSDIKLDVAYNWKVQDVDKVPAIYVQRGDITIVSPTMGQDISFDEKDSEETRLTFNKMPIIVSCVAAEPIAVVENLAEYIKHPLLYFKKEVKLDFKLRDFQLRKISRPMQTKESKNNFVVDLELDTAFDENWIIKREGLKIKTVGMVIFDSLTGNSCNC